MDAGPINGVVLYQQAHHRSNATPIPQCKLGEIVDRTKAWQKWVIRDERVMQGLVEAGFRSCYKLRWIRLDQKLIWALVDRWRPETNTFHMHVGEMTVTLQDVSVIMGLPIGRVNIYRDDFRHDWGQMMDTYLGRRQGQNQGPKVSLDWIYEQYHEVPPNATVAEIEYHVRAFILWTIGKMLMPDSSKGSVSLRWLEYLKIIPNIRDVNWAGAVLCHLYEELKKGALMQNEQLYICGLLLQVWSWERLPLGRPRMKAEVAVPLEEDDPLGVKWSEQRTYEVPSRSVDFYRNELDVLEMSQVTWEPYSLDILQALPAVCTSHQGFWRSKVAMFKMRVVHMHNPDRVMRQFGMTQHIPHLPPRIPDVHGMKIKQRWETLDPYHVMAQQPHLHVQNEREPRISDGAYIAWYWDITRRWIQTATGPPVSYLPRGQIERDLADALRHDMIDAGSVKDSIYATDLRRILANIYDRAKSVLSAHRLMEPEEVRGKNQQQQVQITYKRRARRRGSDAAGCSHQSEDAGTSHGEYDAVPSEQGTEGPSDQGYEVPLEMETDPEADRLITRRRRR